MLPSPADADYIISYERKPPAAIVLRLRYIFSELAKQNLDKEVQKALFQTASKLNEELMYTEKIRNSPLPPLYTSHTTRLLLFYLFWLPLALYGTLRHCFVTILVTLAAGFALLGLDEISHILEYPFLLMPLYQLSKMSMTDAADSIVHRPPPLFVGEAQSDGRPFSTYSKPEYW